MTGRSLRAQSSSLKTSIVAFRAIRAAFRACTKGSRSDFENAAIKTFDRVLVLSGGQIGLACRVEAPRPRDRDQPVLVELRNRLLAELGVTTEGKK